MTSETLAELKALWKRRVDTRLDPEQRPRPSDEDLTREAAALDALIEALVEAEPSPLPELITAIERVLALADEMDQEADEHPRSCPCGLVDRLCGQATAIRAAVRGAE